MDKFATLCESDKEVLTIRIIIAESYADLIRAKERAIQLGLNINDPLELYDLLEK